MTTHNDNFVTLFQEMTVPHCDAQCTTALFNDIGALLTKRILIRLIDTITPEKRGSFLTKITEHKNDPDKIFLFINHFVEDADAIITEEITRCKNDVEHILASA